MAAHMMGWVALAFSCMALGCITTVDGDGCPVGMLDCLCTLGDACDDGLACHAGRCVERAGDGEGVEPGHQTDATGDSDDDFGGTGGVPPAAPSGPMVAAGDCAPGHYEGELEGTYRLGPPLVLPVSIHAREVGGTSGLQFELVANEGEVECDVGKRLCFDYRIEAGIIQGQIESDGGEAGPVLPPAHFTVDLNGQLDCAQGVFVGSLDNGQYVVLGQAHPFEGSIEASYDAAIGAFFDGVWQLAEPDVPELGGDGSWSATDVTR